jgi:hypothetical protein
MIIPHPRLDRNLENSSEQVVALIQSKAGQPKIGNDRKKHSLVGPRVVSNIAVKNFLDLYWRLTFVCQHGIPRTGLIIDFGNVHTYA